MALVKEFSSYLGDRLSQSEKKSNISELVDRAMESADLVLQILSIF